MTFCRPAKKSRTLPTLVAIQVILPLDDTAPVIDTVALRGQCPIAEVKERADSHQINLFHQERDNLPAQLERRVPERLRAR